MSEQIREQVSAFLDGELPGSETELLLKRMTRDAELRESFGRFALIGESLRGGTGARLSQGFSARVNRAIDGAPPPESTQHSPRVRLRQWWRPFVGAAVAAGVAAVAVLALQQRADAPGVDAPGVDAPGMAAPGVAGYRSTALLTARQVSDEKPREPLSYTVPAAVGDAPAVLPAARLTSYVFAHSQYSSVLGQSNVLSGLLTDADEQSATGGDNRALNDSGDAGRPQSKGVDGTP